MPSQASPFFLRRRFGGGLMSFSSRSLRTRDLERAIELRGELFAHIRKHGEFVASRRDDPGISRLLVPVSSAVAAAWWLVDA